MKLCVFSVLDIPGLPKEDGINSLLQTCRAVAASF